jgi:hypothetical protein
VLQNAFGLFGLQSSGLQLEPCRAYGRCRWAVLSGCPCAGFTAYSTSLLQEVPEADSDEELETLLAGTSRHGQQQQQQQAAAVQAGPPEVSAPYLAAGTHLAWVCCRLVGEELHNNICSKTSVCGAGHGAALQQEKFFVGRTSRA